MWWALSTLFWCFHASLACDHKVAVKHKLKDGNWPTIRSELEFLVSARQIPPMTSVWAQQKRDENEKFSGCVNIMAGRRLYKCGVLKVTRVFGCYVNGQLWWFYIKINWKYFLGEVFEDFLLHQRWCVFKWLTRQKCKRSCRLALGIFEAAFFLKKFLPRSFFVFCLFAQTLNKDCFSSKIPKILPPCFV